MFHPSSSTPTSEPELNTVLLDLLAGVQSALGETFVGMYLQGSFAVGDHDKHSDCDFVVAISREVSESELAALRALHKRIYELESRWAQHLEGAYMTTAALRRYRPDNPLHLFLDHGERELVRSDHDNLILERHILLKWGVVLAGVPTSALIDPVSAADLRQEMARAMKEWMKPMLLDASELNSRGRTWYTVLTVCRLLHNLRYATVTSKRVAAEWALRTLDVEWSDLIRRAWIGRPDPAVSWRLPTEPLEVRETVEFIRYALSLIDAEGHEISRLRQRETVALDSYSGGEPNHGAPPGWAG